MKHSYYLEAQVESGEWMRFGGEVGLEYGRGYIACHYESPGPRLAMRVVRGSDGRVMETSPAREEVSIGMVAGWPTEEQYRAAARRATARADGIAAALPPPGIGDVWGAIIEELPEGAARDAAIARRALGIERYGRPLGVRDLGMARQDLAEELLDAAAYGVEAAALIAAQVDGDAEEVDLLTYDAAEHLRRATDPDLHVGFAIGRAVRKLAALKRGGA